MTEFEVRALEIHSQRAWDFGWVVKALDFMVERNLNTLVLHRNDFIDLIVYPGLYFGARRKSYRSIFERYQEIFRKLYKYTPTRRSGPYQRRAYLKRVIEMAKRRGIQVYIENKELYFPDVILEFYPELVKKGKICANDPFWWEFTRVKYKEFFEEFPDIAGIITAIATGESKVSIASNRCECYLCERSTKQDWYKQLVLAMHEPIKEAGRQLVVRDFVFDSSAHRDIASAMESLPEDIIFSLKNTPHDYYPTFPDNPRIGKGKHKQWIEFDSMGQYFGWGIGASIMVDDYRRRMKLAKDSGAVGVIVRTDWESLDGHSSFETVNKVNLYAFSDLAHDLETDSTEIYMKWLDESCYFAPNLSEEKRLKTAQWVEGILGKTWDVTSRTVFVNGCVFSDSSQLPVSLEHALWLAEEKNSLKDWDPSKANALETTEENVRFILDEKEQALALVQQLARKVEEGHDGLTESALKYLRDCFVVFENYVRGFRAAVRAIMLAKCKREKADDPALQQFVDAHWDEALQELLELADKYDELFATTDYGHRVYTLLDADRLRALHQDLTEGLMEDDHVKEVVGSSG